MTWLVFVLVLLIFLYASVVALFSLWKSRLISTEDKKFFVKHWGLIIGEKDELKQIISADKLLEQILARKGYRGSMGDKLKAASGQFNDLDSLWSAHKLRNKIAHEVGFNLNSKQHKCAINAFTKAFADLGFLK